MFLFSKISPVCESKGGLVSTIGETKFKVGNEWYNVSGVKVAPSFNYPVVAFFAGGIIGALLGSIGIWIGVIFGEVISLVGEMKEYQSVERFNQRLFPI